MKSEYVGKMSKYLTPKTENEASWGTGIRTPIPTSKGLCPTVRRFPKINYKGRITANLFTVRRFPKVVEMDFAYWFEAPFKPNRFIISPLKIALQFWLKQLSNSLYYIRERAQLAIWGIICIMPIKQKELTDVPKTDSGATIGSTGEVVDARVNRLLILKEKERAIRKANEEAEARKRKSQEEGGINTK